MEKSSKSLWSQHKRFDCKVHPDSFHPTCFGNNAIFANLNADNEYGHYLDVPAENKMNQIEEKQKRRIKYYDKFSSVYDFFAGKFFYHKARSLAVKELDLTQGQTVLNLPCGTGQNFEYFQKYLANTGKIIGIDLSDGMLQKGQEKIKKTIGLTLLLKKMMREE